MARNRQHALKGEIVAFRRDLEGDMYKDADVKYRDKMIELKVCLYLHLYFDILAFLRY